MKTINRSSLRQFYGIAAAFLLAGGGALYFNSRFGMFFNDFYFLFAILGFLLLLFFLDRAKKTTPGLIAAILLPTILFAWIGFTVCSSLDLRDGVFSWWQNYTPGNMQQYDSGNALFTGVVYTSLASTVAYLLQKLFVLRIVCAVGVLGALVAATVLNEELPFFTLVLAAAYLIAILAEGCLKTSGKRTQKVPSGAAALFLLPVFLLSSLSAAAIPRSDKPIDWTFVVEAYDAVHYWFDTLLAQLGINQGESYEFSLNLLGFSETGDLGGNVKLTNGNVLEVSYLTDRSNLSLYLKGSVHDIYTGEGWEHTNGLTRYNAEHDMDTLETLYALVRHYGYGNIPENIAGRRGLRISYRDILTKTLFYPPNTLYIGDTINEKAPQFYDKNGTISFELPLRDAKYDLSYLDLNRGNPDFTAFIHAEENYRYDPTPPADGTEFDLEEFASVKDEWRDVLLDTTSLSHIPETGFGWNDSLEYSLSIRSNWIKNHSYYTILPDTVPQRVYDLAEEITAGYDSDYDKLLAIEAYLAENYEYTLTPGDVPEGVDFVDYFLFENKQGYCTYFATAMAVLARCVDIPTRYVQGFSSRLHQWVSGKELTYLVQGTEAHAWPEAYIEGIGWIAFEPTASRQREFYTDWDYYEPILGESEENLQTSPVPEPNNDLIGPGVQNGDDEGFTFTWEHAVLLGIFVLIFAILFAFLRFRAKVKKKERHYRRAKPADKIILDFKKIFFLLHYSGYPPESGETLHDYAERVAPYFRTPSLNLTDVAESYSRIYYGKKEPRANDLKQAQEMRDLLIKICQRRSNFFRRIIFWFRLRNEK